VKTRSDPPPRPLEAAPPAATPQGCGCETSVRPHPRLVPTALVFYAVMLALAALGSWLAGASLFYASPEAARAGVHWGRDAGTGLAAAALMVLASQQLTLRTRWGARTARALGALLGYLDWRRCLLLAAASGVAEEALFRGALQPRVGLVAASLLFGLAHFVPRRELLPWTLLSLVAGFVLGGLFAATGNLLAPVLAHAVVNALNLRFVSRRYAPR